MSNQHDCAFFPSVNRAGTNGSLMPHLDSIKSGRWRARIEQLRRLVAGVEQERCKRRLPAIMLSCTTKNGGHKNADIGEHTGLLQIDIDKLSSPAEAQKVRDQLRSDPYVLASWLSPGAHGVKAIVRIERSLELHLSSFKTAERRFKEVHGLTIDARCNDPVRLCFVSYDPDLWVNEDAEVLQPMETPESAGSGGTHGGSSSTDLPSPSSTLPTAPTGYVLQSHELFRDFPDLLPLYRHLVVNRYQSIQPGQRNDALCDMIPMLYSAIRPKFIVPFADVFYLQNEGIFNDPRSKHLEEARSLLKGCADDYAKDLLSDAERRFYLELDELEQAAFRIFHALAACDIEDTPPPVFFMSREKLAIRLGCLQTQARSVTKRLLDVGAIQLLEKGQRREKGILPRASRYRWNLPSLRVISAECLDSSEHQVTAR